MILSYPIVFSPRLGRWLVMVLLLLIEGGSFAADLTPIPLEDWRSATFNHRRLGSPVPSASTSLLARRLFLTIGSTSAPQLQSDPQIEADSYNRYLYGGIFRVIYGRSYEFDPNTRLLAERVLTIAQTVAERYLTDYQLRGPSGSESYYIDLYIGNRSARNWATGRTATIESYYAAFADQYLGLDVGFMVINPVLGDGDLLEVVVAHEMLHLIQFAYKSSEIYLYSDLWFLEATATAAEELSYPDSNDYVRFVNSWYSSCQLALNTFNGSHEYGAAIFVLYLIDRLGFEVVRYIFEGFAEQDGWQTIIDQVLTTHYQLTLAEIYTDFIQAVKYPESYFSDGALFDDHRRVLYTLSDTASVTVQEYGIYFARLPNRTRLQWSDPLVRYWLERQGPLCQTSSDLSLELTCEAGAEVGLYTANRRSSVELGRPVIHNSTQTLSLHEGWNLVNLGVNDRRSLSEIVAGVTGVEAIFLPQPAATTGEITWQVVAQPALAADTLTPLTGFWIKTSMATELTLVGEAILQPLPAALHAGWNLIGLAEGIGVAEFEALLLQQGEQPRRLWGYDEKGWLSYDFVNHRGSLIQMEPNRGLWVWLD